MNARVMPRVIPTLVRGAVGGALLLALVGCQKSASKEEEPAASASAAPAASASAAAAPAAVAAAAVAPDVPTSEDYEQQALDEINPQNMEAQIDKLEKDIGK